VRDLGEPREGRGFCDQQTRVRLAALLKLTTTISAESRFVIKMIAGLNQHEHCTHPRQSVTVSQFDRKILNTVGLLLVSLAASAANSRPLEIYFIDVEGGQATLLVSPSHQSVLIDTGWPGSRDADRIAAAAKTAKLKQIDYVILTHYHEDHVGGLADLQQRIPIGILIDHGSDVEDSDSAKKLYAAYQKATEHSKHIHLTPGEGLPLHDISLEVLSAAGQHISEPLPGAGEANFYCSSESEAKSDASENAQSIGVLVSYGKFRFLDLGDLTKQKELELVCPNNLIGKVSLYLTTHHGTAPDNPKAFNSRNTLSRKYQQK
jgi:competence protein ComEC